MGSRGGGGGGGGGGDSEIPCTAACPPACGCCCCSNGSHANLVTEEWSSGQNYPSHTSITSPQPHTTISSQELPKHHHSTMWMQICLLPYTLRLSPDTQGKFRVILSFPATSGLATSAPHTSKGTKRSMKMSLGWEWPVQDQLERGGSLCCTENSVHVWSKKEFVVI